MVKYMAFQVIKNIGLLKTSQYKWKILCVYSQEMNAQRDFQQLKSSMLKD